MRIKVYKVCTAGDGIMLTYVSYEVVPVVRVSRMWPGCKACLVLCGLQR